MILNLCCWASPQKFPPGKRFHSLCCGLLNVCIGKSHCSLHCWLERTKVSPMQPLSKLKFSLFKVCHVLRWLLVHTIHRSTAPSKVKLIWTRLCFFSSAFFLSTYLLYASSAIIGTGGPILWSAQVCENPCFYTWFTLLVITHLTQK